MCREPCIISWCGGINKAKIFDIDIVDMPAVVSGIQYFELDRENGRQLMTKQTLVKYQRPQNSKHNSYS